VYLAAFWQSLLNEYCIVLFSKKIRICNRTISFVELKRCSHSGENPWRHHRPCRPITSTTMAWSVFQQCTLNPPSICKNAPPPGAAQCQCHPITLGNWDASKGSAKKPKFTLMEKFVLSKNRYERRRRENRGAEGEGNGEVSPSPTD